MAKNYAFRYVNEVTGTFVILSLLAALVALFFAAGAQRWFTPGEKLRVLLPLDGSHGLREGAEVKILGTVAGEVEKIAIRENGRMMAKLRIERDFFQFVREDSLPVIRKEISLSGGSYMEISRGASPHPPRREIPLEATAEKDLKTVITEILDRVESETVPTLREFTLLAAALRSPEGQLQRLLHKANRIAENLEQGDGVIPALLNDQAMMRDLAKTLQGVNATLASLQGVLLSAETTSTKMGGMTDNLNRQLEALTPLMPLAADVLNDTKIVMGDLRQVTSRLPELSRELEGEGAALPGLLLQTTATLQEIERLVTGLQKHWLVRGSIEQKDAPGRIPPEAVDAARSGP